ncbi:hypothetical protein [Leptodesmis sp.]|uniref:hypothetical protein n=1 Tax=Leptodesmis sp. TaxID=3100501 RepID=UPI00405353C6
MLQWHFYFEWAHQALPIAEEKATVGVTVDLPLSLHQALTDLAQQQGKRKAILVRWATPCGYLQSSAGGC